MKTKLFTLLLAVAASVGTMFSGTCADAYIGGVLYNLYGAYQVAEVTSCYENSYTGDITIPASVTYNDLVYSVTSIGDEAFYNCSNLTSVTIGNSVTSIGERAFYNCTSLTAIDVAADNPNYCSEGGVLFNKDKTTLVAYPGGIQVAYTIPNSVTSIGDYAFCNCRGLTSVTIPNSVISIGNYAFSGCSSLTSVTIPNSVVSIGDYAFSGLTSVTINSSDIVGITYTSSSNLRHIFGSQVTEYIIGDDVTSIGNYAFYDCRGLTSVTIGNSVTSIGEYAFYRCQSLTSVTIGNSVTSIGYDAFYGCRGLTSVTIPNSVTSIGKSAFYGCSGLTSIYVPCGELERFRQMLNYDLSSKVKYEPLPYNLTISAENGSVTYPITICDDMELSTSPNYGYHFTQWSDGVKDNPRTIVLTQDTTFTAEFAKNKYTISTQSANQTWGTTAGDTTAQYLDEVEISAIPNHGYHFVRWNDYNTSNPRTVSVTEDKTYTATFAKNVYSITTNAEHGSISGNNSAEYLDFVALTVTPDYGYHFVQWSDGITDNPRTFVMTQDTTLTAEFAKNTYTISTTSANPEWGTTAGDKSALYLDEVEISAIPNHGYHFVRWNDYNTSNPRTVSVTEDKTYTATFAKNVYSITTNAEHGSISGNNSAEYLDFVALTVTPDYGYHFVQWSDGLKDNPRIFQITSDTTFTAEFAYDRVGTCGKDLALVWSYDPNSKVLTIGNAGSFTENMQFGAEAPNEMEELVIGNSVTAIGANAFAGIETLKKITIGESVKTIGEQAFYNCVNLETIFNYRPTPTNTYSNAFDGVDKFECALYVLSSSIDMYKNASVWRDFYYTYTIGAEETIVTTNDVTVEPQDNAATVTWPTNDNAASYTIEITKDGVLFCTLTFNANGQLTGIAFAPSRDGHAHASAAVMTANGLQFTVTGLNSNTQYGYNLIAKDANNQPIATYSGEFTTTGEIATDIDNIQGNEVQSKKFVRNGQIFILRGDKTYTLQGQEVK